MELDKERQFIEENLEEIDEERATDLGLIDSEATE
jgi:hypothetical protein